MAGHSKASEKLIVEEMITLYCRKKHGTETLCPECRVLLDYVFIRLERCPFTDEKSFCSHCPIYCYKPDMQKKIRQVMAFSGSRMIFHHPVLLLRHALKG